MRVLDFGCGGGNLLANIECREKLGIEVNPVARQEAHLNGIRAVASTEDVPDSWADIAISNSALEHCGSPLGELQSLLPKVRPGGRAVFVVPCEAIRYRYVNGDINHHLFSWSPMGLGNLFQEAGFTVLESKAYLHLWPPRFIPKLLRRVGGRPLFEFGCSCYGLALSFSPFAPITGQVRVVAERPER